MSRIRNDVWDLTAGSSLWSIPGNPGEGIAFSSDGERLVTGNQVWDSRTGELLLELPAQTWDMSVSADAKIIMLGGRVWNAGPNGEAGVIDLPAGGLYWEGVEVASDHGVALHMTQGSGIGTAYVYELFRNDDSVWGEVRPGIENVFGDPALSPDGGRIAVQQERKANHYGPIGIYDSATGDLLQTLEGLCDTDNDTILPTPGCSPFPETPFSGLAWDMAWLPDGKSLAVSRKRRVLITFGMYVS